jgi:hypothetical protein
LREAGQQRCDETEPQCPLRAPNIVVDTLAAWFSFLTGCITRTNWSYPPSFFLSTRAYSISPDHISRSQCDGLCHVTLSHTYTHRGEPTLHSKKFANKELRAAHNAHHPQRAYHTQQYPAYITTTHYLKIPTTKYTTTQSTSPKPARGCPSGCVIEVCTMSAWPQIDRPRTLTSAPSCSLSSSLSTMADDALHTHKRNGTPWSGIRTRTAPSTVNTRRQPLSMQKRLAPCAKPTLRADAAALLALLATVHDGWQRPAQ